MISTELRLALAPARTYKELAAADGAASWRAIAAGPAFALLVIGTLVPVAATGRVTLGLALTIALSWSFAVAVQALAAVAIIASAPRRPVGAGRAFALLFLGHVPWSLSLLSLTALLRLSPAPVPDIVLLLLILLAIAWTAVLMAAFCREVLGTDGRGARLRTAGHQVIVWSLALQYVAFAAGGWFRIVEGIAGR